MHAAAAAVQGSLERYIIASIKLMDFNASSKRILF